VQGDAANDADFVAGGDRTRYSVTVDQADGPFAVEAELWFQPIGYRWADNLSTYDAFETNRFVRYWRSMSAGSAIAIASATATAR
jgi:hypothetical protein